MASNDYYSNISMNLTTVPSHKQPNILFMHFIKVVYVLGIIGNAAAIFILRRGERRIRNRKHLLLMTTLAGNDLVALMGMLSAMLVSEHLPWVKNTKWYCGVRVVLRVFGIGSVCIAVNMALERYLALTRPFFYQKQITYYVIRTTLLASWWWAAILTCSPIFGFGLYYDEDLKVCTRYRHATKLPDFVYAVLYVAFGTLLCVVLVYCNMAVIRALYAISSPNGDGPPIVRRVSKSSCRTKNVNCRSVSSCATAEEVAFSRLMATLAVLFMICWLPQMITSSLYLSLDQKHWPRLNLLANLSDLLMLFNYVLDPILYVLMRSCRFSANNVCRPITNCLKHKSHTTSSDSTRTYHPQETLIMSDNSSGGTEIKPLRGTAIPLQANIYSIHD